MPVPLMDIAAQYGPLRAEIDAAVAGVLDSGRFILGPEGRALEATVSERLGGRPCAGVANGTDALVIALNALDIGPGDEVITTPYTFYATAEAIARVGATPVFCDIDPVTYCLDPDGGARRGSAPATRAILPVHIFGHPADMPAIMDLAARARPEGGGGLRPGLRRPARRRRDRHLRRRGHLQLLPHQELPRDGRRRHGGVPRRGPGRARQAAALPRLQGQGRVRRGGLQLAPRRPPGRDHPRLLPAPRRLERPPRRRRRLVRGGGARRASWTLPGVARGRGTSTTSSWRGTPSRDEAARGGCRRPASAAPSTTASRCTCSPCSPGSATARATSPWPRRRRGTALALPMHPNLSREDVAEVVAAARRASGGWRRPLAPSAPVAARRAATDRSTSSGPVRQLLTERRTAADAPPDRPLG